MMPPVLAELQGKFSWVDWLVVVAYLAFTSWLGARMAGKQATIRDFFLGGRKLPWYAVSGSIIATEISALTFISVPWVVFQPGGNMTYLQLGVFGSFFARIIVGYILVPVYYEKEIYSPYDYMGNQLGGRVRSMTTALFTLGGLLGQSARIYLTAQVLIVLVPGHLYWLESNLGLDMLAWAILMIMLVSVAWTLVGGMTTVIWTDVVLFIAFFTGALIALGTVVYSLEGGLGELLRTGWDAVSSGVPWASWGQPATSGPWGKFTFFDFSTDPVKTYTIWTAVIASTWGGLGAYGTDQLMAQRMFCCKNIRDARWAIISSSLSVIVTIIVAMVGIGLYAYYQTHTPSEGALRLLAEKKHGDRIFPVFAVEIIPIGLKGLIIAAIFGAAISSVMGILTALSQTIQTAFYNPHRERSLAKRGMAVSLAASAEAAAEHGTASHEDRRSVVVGRLLVIFWGVALGGMAYLAQLVAARYPSILDLGLAMAGYCGGALLAGFALGFLRLRIDGYGFMWSGPLSVGIVFSLVWHEWWAHIVCWIIAAALLTTWVGVGLSKNLPPAVLTARGLFLAAGVAAMLALTYYGYAEVIDPVTGVAKVNADTGYTVKKVLAWPWYAPIGSLFAFFWGWGLANKKA
jgi:Na+/proline symporter